MATIFSSKQTTQASTTKAGEVVLATNQEVIDGINNTKVVTPAALQAKIDELGGAVGGDVGAVQAELNTTQTGAGLNTNGTYTAPVGTNYLGSATSLKNADSLLDAKIKLNADSIALKANQTYVDDVITAYQAADSLLDGRLTTAESEIDTLQSDLTTAEGEIDTLQSGLTTAQGEIDTLQSDLDAAELLIATKADSATVSAINVRLTTAEGEIDTLQDDVSAIDVRLTSAEGEIDTLQDDVLAIDTRLDALESGGGTIAVQTELDATQVSIGISDDGSLPVYSSTSYIANVDSHHVAIGKLDQQLSVTQSDLDSAELSITLLQSELDQSQLSTGLNIDGTKSNYSSTSYIANVDSHHVAIGKLDQQLSTTQSDLDIAEASLATKASSATVSAIDARLTSVEGDLTDLTTEVSTKASQLSVTTLSGRVSVNESDIDTLQSDLDAAELLIATKASQTEVDLIETAVGLNANGSYSAHVGSNYIDGATSTKSALGLLDGVVKVNENDISNLATQIDEIIANGADNAAVTALQSELDATQTGAGLSITGAYVVNGDANYINIATSLSSADNLLDAQIQVNEDAISALDGRLTTAESDIDTLQSDLATAEGDIDTLQSDVSAIDGRLTTAESDIDTLQSDVSTLQSDLDAAELLIATKADSATVSAIDVRLTTAEGEIDVLQGDLVNAQADISAIDIRLTSAEGDIDTLQDDVSAIDVRLTTAEGEIDVLQGDVSTLQSDLDAAELLIATKADSATVSAIDVRLTSAEGDIDTLQSDLLSVESDISGLDGRLTTAEGEIDTLQGDVSSLQSLADTHELAIGLNENGTYSAIAGNYATGASIKTAITQLDTQVKVNTDAIALKASSASLSLLQSELDQSQLSIGLNIDGTFTVPESNYIVSTSIKTALTDLDTQIKVNEDAISQEISDRQSADSLIQSELDQTQLGAGLNANGTYTTPAGNNYLGGASLKADIALLDIQLASTQSDLDTAEVSISNIQTEVNTIETSVGLQSDGTKSNYSSTSYIANIDSHHVAIGKLDAAIAMVDTSGVGSIQTEIDAIETSLGLDTDGTFIAKEGSNYLDSATNYFEIDDLLDAQIKINEDAIASNASDISAIDARVELVELRDGGILGQIDARDEVIFDSTLSEFQGFSGPLQINLSQLVSTGNSDIIFGWCSAPRMSDRHLLVSSNGDVTFTGIEA